MVLQKLKKAYETSFQDATDEQAAGAVGPQFEVPDTECDDEDEPVDSSGTLLRGEEDVEVQSGMSVAGTARGKSIHLDVNRVANHAEDAHERAVMPAIVDPATTSSGTSFKRGWNE